MSKLHLLNRRLIAQEDGQSMAEYGILLCLIGIFLISTVNTVGQSVLDILGKAKDAIVDAMT